MRAASTSRVSKPGSTLFSRMKLRTNKPAPTSSTRARVTSPTTSVPCSRRRPPVAPGASSRSASSIPGAEARQAGRGGGGNRGVGGVAAGDQQPQAQGGKQNARRPPHAADRGVRERGGVEAGVEHRPPAGGRGGEAAAGAGLARHDSLPPTTTRGVAGAETRREQPDVVDHT